MRGRDTEDTAVTGTAYLSHVLPSPVEKLEPKDAAALVGGGVVRWSPVPGAVKYIVKVENEEKPQHSLSSGVPSSKTSFAVPADWITAEGEHTLVLGVVNRYGNLTEVQYTFEVERM